MPYYSDEDIRKLRVDYRIFLTHADQLFLDMMRLHEALKNKHAKEQLLHGAMRRIKLLRHAIKKVYALFPLNQDNPLDYDVRYDVTIFLQSISINISGYLDNLAWVYVHEKGVCYKRNTDIGFFSLIDKNLFPSEFCNYIRGTKFKDWNLNHAKEYRDALAHRIPLYVPPYGETKKGNLVLPVYVGSLFNSDKGVLFHPQILADFNLLYEISRNYLRYAWECSRE